MKIYNLIVISALLTILVAPAFSQDNVIEEVVWVVGDEPILRSEVEEQRLNAQLEGIKFSGDPYCIIPEELAVNKLYLHQADLDSIQVEESDVVNEVDRRINWMIQRFGSKEKLEEYQLMSLDKIREIQRSRVKDEMTIQRVRNKLLENIAVTPSDVRQYFKNLPEDSMPIIPAECEVEMISIEPKMDDAEIEAIKDRLREFTDRINKGENFSTLAVMYSEDRNSAKVGGELGFQGKGVLLPEFANVAFSLTDPKKVSKIVETEYGFHIIQLIEKRGDRINCRHILLKPKVSASQRNQALMKLDSIADLIRNQKIRFEDAAMFFSSDKDTKNNGGLMVNATSGTSKFQLEELPPEIGKAVYQMNVGEISKPFTMTNAKDQQECVIIRVKSKTKAHKASMSEDFQLLKKIVLEKKSEKILQDWIKEKQKKTYVRISENWRNCEFKYPGWIK
jgi:peptidyl-prolyl cis-trans isomerase SurA